MDRIKSTNLTLVIDEELLRAARKVALDQQTSVNHLVRQFLTALVQGSTRRRLARARLQKKFDAGLVRVGKRNWKREELYDR